MQPQSARARRLAIAIILGVAITQSTAATSIQKRGSDAKPGGKMVRVELSAAATIKVRTKNPPPRFDEKGRFQKYTSDELRELKGDNSTDQRLPGYKSEYGNLKKGDIVQVSLGVPREDAKDKAKTVVTANGPQLTGRISEFGESDNKVIVLEIPLNQAAALNSLITKDINYLKSGSKIAVEPKQAQIALVVVLQEGPGQEASDKRKGKKKN